MVQDKNSLARLSQGGCYPDGREDCAHTLLLSFNPGSQTQSHRDTQKQAHTFISVTNPEIDVSRNTETQLAPLFDREQCGEGVKIKRGHVGACL